MLMARRIALLALVALLCATLAAAQTIVDIANNNTDPNNLDDSEPSIAVDPTNAQRIAVVSFSGGWANGAKAPVWMSNDGGKTWSKLNILPAPANGSTGPGDQKLVWGNDGKLYVTELASGVNVPRCFIYRPIGVNTYAAGAAYGDDQPHLDRYNVGAFTGRLLSPWLNFGVFPEQSTVTRTTDAGVTVMSAAAGNNSFPNRTTRIAISPFNNRAYIIYKQRQGQLAGTPFETATFRVARSDDGGASWGAIGPAGAGGVALTPAPVQTWFTSSWGDAAKGKVGRARSSDAWIAVNPSNGDVWATFCNRNAAGLGQVYAAISTDGGATWSAPKQVSDGTRNSAFPEIAVAANGSIGVLYVDYDASGAQTIFRHRFGSSFNSGLSWSTLTLDSFSTQQLSNGTNGFLWGDYEGLTAVGHRFFGAFTGKSINRANVQFDPIFFSATAVGGHQDVYVRDWTAGVGAANHDQGQEPSTNPTFWTTSDVWNQRTVNAPVFNANNQPVNGAPLPGATNFLYARISRNSSLVPLSVRAKFFWAPFGSSNPFVAAGNVNGTLVSMPVGANSVVMPTPHSWILPATASTQISIATQISTDRDPPMPPLLPGGLVPGTTVSNLAIMLDNNKAQRNTAVFGVAEVSDPITYYALVGNPLPEPRQATLVFSTDDGTAVEVRDATVGDANMRDGTEGAVTSGPRGRLDLGTLAPGESRSIGFRFTGGRTTSTVNVDDVTNGVVTAGFSITRRPGTAAEVRQANLDLRANVLQRIGATWNDATAQSEAATVAQLTPADYARAQETGRQTIARLFQRAEAVGKFTVPEGSGLDVDTAHLLAADAAITALQRKESF
jgi:hypothetical protein